MFVTSVWTSYGHRFMSTGDVNEDKDSSYEKCLTCGYLAELVPDEDNEPEWEFGSGEYRTSGPDRPNECSRRTDIVHGIERHCEADNGRQCADNLENGICTHTDHVCNCIMCDG